MLFYTLLIVVAAGALASLWIAFQFPTPTKSNNNASHKSVSVICPMRNEAKTILPKMQSLVAQQHDAEVQHVIIDDHSTDTGSRKVEQFLSNHANVDMVCLKATEEGKKNAILDGLAAVKYNKVQLTDADTFSGNQWLSTMMKQDAGLVIGPVLFQEKRGLIPAILQAELLVILTLTGAMANFGKPVSANGANMLLDKKLLEDAMYSESNQVYASGDDIFTLEHAIESGVSIKYCGEKEALIETYFPKSIRHFLQQRIRWASKISGYQNKTTLLFSRAIGLYQALPFFCVLLTLAGFISFPQLLILYAVKLISDAFLLIPSVFQFRKVATLWAWPLMNLWLAIYVPVIIMAVTFSKGYRWKGRRVED